MSIKKLVSLAWTFSKIEMMLSMEHFMAFVFVGVGTIVRIATTLIFFEAIYLQVDSIAGWEISHLLVLLGTFYLVESISWATYLRGFWGIAYYIENGWLDIFLSKPLSIRSFLSVHKTDIVMALPQFISALGMLFYGISMSASPIHLLSYFFIIICAVLIHFSLVLIFSSVNFFTILKRTFWLMGEITDLGKYPITIYKGAAKLFLSFVIPLGIMYTFPARAMFGNLHLYEFLIAALWAIMFYVGSSLFWDYGLKRYESASG